MINQRWSGSVELEYTNQNHNTKLIKNRTRAPLKVQRSFYPEGLDICHNIIVHTAGGVVGGDELVYDIRLNPNSKALITTPSATKVYGSPELMAFQTINIKIAKNAYLEWLPQETILFKNAYYHQKLCLELESDAVWFGWEITRLGRTARSESFAQGQFHNYIEVWQSNQPLWIDRQSLIPNEEILNSPLLLAKMPILGTLSCIGKPIPDRIFDEINGWGLNPFNIGVTSLLTQGLLCRYRGDSSTEVKKWFTKIWHLLRQSQFQLSPILPRVWN